jgi:hypothetical protein
MLGHMAVNALGGAVRKRRGEKRKERVMNNEREENLGHIGKYNMLRRKKDYRLRRECGKISYRVFLRLDTCAVFGR